METKEELIQNIKEWIKIDTEITELKNKIKEKNLLKKGLTEGLMNTMKKNTIDCFDINGGSIVYKKNKVKKPISGKNLLQILQTYFQNEDAHKAEDITKFVLDNREEQIKEVIKHKIDKV